MWSKANKEQPSNKQQLKMWQDVSPPQQEDQRLTIPEESDKVLNKTVNHCSRTVKGRVLLTVPIRETITCGLKMMTCEHWKRLAFTFQL